MRGFAEYRMVIYSLLLIILMITRPQGLLGSTEAFKGLAHACDDLPKVREVARPRRRPRNARSLGESENLNDER